MLRWTRLNAPQSYMAPWMGSEKVDCQLDRRLAAAPELSNSEWPSAVFQSDSQILC